MREEMGERTPMTVREAMEITLDYAFVERMHLNSAIRYLERKLEWYPWAPSQEEPKQ